MTSETYTNRVTPDHEAGTWDGDGGVFWADYAELFDQAMAIHRVPFLGAAAITPSDRVLDVGCGVGQTTRDAARAAVAGSALGMDLSARVIDYARRTARREGLGNATFEHADVRVHPFAAGAFDVAVSRTGAMFFGDPVAAFANVARALRPGGRLCLLAWQSLAGNEWLREFMSALAAGRDLPVPPPRASVPFTLGDPGRVRALLTAAGFTGVRIGARLGGMRFGRDADDAYRFVRALMSWMLHGLDDRGRYQALSALRSTIAAHDTGNGIIYPSAAWIIRAIRP